MNALRDKTYAVRMIPRVYGGTRRYATDADVLELMRQGRHSHAFDQLMTRHGDAVYRYCRIMLGDAVLADDVHQQVFLEAFRNLSRFRGLSSLRTWLLGIARHRALDAKKRRRSMDRTVDSDLVDVADPCPTPGESLDDGALRRALSASLEELPPLVRSAVLLRYQQGLTYEDMAAISGEKPGTLQARVARALPCLRRAIEARLAER